MTAPSTISGAVEQARTELDKAKEQVAWELATAIRDELHPHAPDFKVDHLYEAIEAFLR